MKFRDVITHQKVDKIKKKILAPLWNYHVMINSFTLSMILLML